MHGFVTASDSGRPLQFSAFVTQAHWETGQWAGAGAEPQPDPPGWPLSSREGRLDISIQHLERQGTGENAAIQRSRPLSPTRRPIVRGRGGFENVSTLISGPASQFYFGGAWEKRLTCLESLDSSSNNFSSGGTNVRRPAFTLKERHKAYDLF